MVTRRAFLGAGASALGLAVLPGSPAHQRRKSAWAGLARRLEGDLILPSDPNYTTAKQLELMQFDSTHPQAIAYCVSPDDVSLALRFAQQHGVDVAVRSGGHSYGGYSTTTGLLIDVSRLNSISTGSTSVTIGPGAQNVDVLNTLHSRGLVVGGGGCPTVAAGGFIQGGGFGFLTRSIGLACDALTSAQVVLADGRLVSASATEHPDLFWALRGGGGGNFGIVTSYEVAPHQATPMPTAILSFPYDRSVTVLDGFVRWLVDAPDAIGGGAYVNLADAAPGAVAVTTVTLTSRGSADQLAAEVSRLISMTGSPAARQGGTFSYRDLMMLVFGCAGLTAEQCHRSVVSAQGQLSRPAFGLERSRLCNEPIAEPGWAQIISAFDAYPMAGQFRQLEVHAFGGVSNDIPRTASAYVHRDALFCVNFRDTISDPQLATAEARSTAKHWVDGGFSAIDPLSSGESYQNWIDPELTGWRAAYYAENYPRLRRIKADYDPAGLFDFAQGIGARG